MITLKNIMLVGFGGALGAMLRFLFSSLFKYNNFPTATLLINIIGSFTIGLVMALNIKNETLSAQIKLFLATGLCGGFTTFSAFSAENMELLKQGNYASAFVYIFLSILLCLVSVFAGFKIINYPL